MRDQFGNSIATHSASAREHFDAASDLIRLYRGDPIAALDAALEADGDLLSAEERFSVEQAIRACRNFCGGSDLQALRQATERLTRLTDPFAERRMDRAVGMALAGQSIDKF